MHLARLVVLTPLLLSARHESHSLSLSPSHTRTLFHMRFISKTFFFFLVSLCKQEAIGNCVKDLYGLDKRVAAVGNVRKLNKLDMKLNDALPKIEVDPETYTVTADGQVLTCSPATTVPLSRNYFMF